MKNLIIPVVVCLFLLSGCAETEMIEQCVDATEREGFLMGLIQGFIAPIAFIISIFDSDTAIYAVNNNGVWYDLGFLIGIGGFSGGILKGRRASRRNR